MLGLNESSSMEEWQVALCKIDDSADFLKKNPDFMKKCPYPALTVNFLTPDRFKFTFEGVLLFSHGVLYPDKKTEQESKT